MKKYITFALLGLIAIMLFLIAVPQSCNKETDQLQNKSDRSSIIDSIQKSLTERVNKKSDSLVNVLKDSIYIISAQKERVEVKYYALRAKIKHLPAVRVDSAYKLIEGTISDSISLNKGPFISNNLYITGIPIYQYNALINSGTMCDSLLMYLDSELMLKDSIISVREIQTEIMRENVKTSQLALSDLIALNNEERKQKEKAKKWNKKIPLIGVICTNIGALIAIFALK